MNWLSYITPLEILKVKSPLNGEIKVVERFGKRTLLVNDAEQSGGTITGMWQKVIKSINNQQLTISNCLVLGLGGGTVIKLLNTSYPKLNITAVEFDPDIIDIAEKYFRIKSSSTLKIIHADAFFWIKTAMEKFDFIIFDLYLGKKNPKKSRELSFLKDLKKLLIPSGYIFYNAHYQQDEKNCQKLLKECRRLFPNVNLLLNRPYSRILFLGN